MARPHVPPIEASIDIDASPAAVWAVLADQRRMNAFAPETWKQAYLGGTPVKAGTVSLNLNRRGAAVWPTISRYRDVVPEQRLAFSVVGPAATWSYELEPTATGTRVIERRRLKRDRPTLASLVTARLLLGGVAQHDQDLQADMLVTLERLKAAAEAS